MSEGNPAFLTYPLPHCTTERHTAEYDGSFIIPVAPTRWFIGAHTYFRLLSFVLRCIQCL